MKFLYAVIMLLTSQNVAAQKANFSVHNICLPSEIAYYDNQFSGLYIKDNNLFLMSESRLQDSAEAKLYSIKLSDIERQLADSTYKLPYKKWSIYNLNILRSKMKANGDDYEGLEAIIINKNKIYFSIETATPSNNCYLVKGIINDTAILLDENKYITLVKPLDEAGKHIYNAGFEAMVLSKNDIYSFFEYNFFNDVNKVKKVNVRSFSSTQNKSLSIQKLPFRITDVTAIGRRKFIAVNYFYNGGGEDEIYRTPKADSANHHLIYDSGFYKSYSRLITIKKKNHKFTWQPLWEFPKEFRSYNWEGITAYKRGYFVINDKYTAARPYKSVLLYLMFTK